MEVKPEWITVQDVTVPTIADMDAAIAATRPDAPRLLETTAASNIVVVPNTTIASLAKVQPLMRSPFLTPINAWNLIAARAISLGLERGVTPLLHWLWSQRSQHAKAVDALFSVDLSDATLQSRQELRDRIIPPLPTSPIHTPVQNLPQLLEAASPPPVAKQSIGT